MIGMPPRASCTSKGKVVSIPNSKLAPKRRASQVVSRAHDSKSFAESSSNALSVPSCISPRLSPLPALLPRESLVQERKDLGDVELDVFQVEVILVVLLHL